MKKIKVLRQINFDTDIFMTTFEKASELLLTHKERLEKEGWTSIHLKFELYYDGAELNVYGHRLETDEEFAIRQKEELKKKKAEEKKLERKRKQYEKLKKEFDN